MTFASFAPFGVCFSYDRFATANWNCEKPNKIKIKLNCEKELRLELKEIA